MKRTKSRFSSTPSFLEKGGEVNPLASAAGQGIDMVGNLFYNKGPELLSADSGNARSADALDKYNSVVQKSQKNKQAVTGTIDAASNAAMMIPGIGTAVGLGLKGINVGLKALPWGKNKANDAMGDFKFMEQAGTQEATTANANKMFNTQATLKAYDFGMPMGKSGLKLKSREQREFYSKSTGSKTSRFKNSKTKFTKQ